MLTYQNLKNILDFGYILQMHCKILPQFEPIWQNFQIYYKKIVPIWAYSKILFKWFSIYLDKARKLFSIFFFFSKFRKLTCNVNWCTNEKWIFSQKNFKCHIEDSMINLSKQDQIAKDLFLILGSVLREKGSLSC